MKLFKTWLFMLLALVSLNVWAAHRSTEQEAAAFLEKAVSYFEKEGVEKALVAFNRTEEGEFYKGDLYVFVLDAKGVFHAYAPNPKMVGTSGLELNDAAGKPVIKSILDTANANKGTAKVEYVWLNRQTNQVENKTSLVRKVGDYVLGVGYYH